MECITNLPLLKIYAFTDLTRSDLIFIINCWWVSLEMIPTGVLPDSRWSESACRKADCVANTCTHCWSCLDSNLTRINKIGLRLDSYVWIYKTGRTLGPQKVKWLSWVQSSIHSSKLKVVCVAEDGTNQLGVTICVCFSQMLQINNQVENIWTFSTLNK